VKSKNLQGKDVNQSAETNPYLDARRSWDERYGDLLTRAKNWRAAAFLCSLIALVATGGLVASSLRSHITTYIVAVDKQGHVVDSGVADQSAVVDDRLKRAALYEWVTNLRSVSVDALAQRRAIDRVYSMIASGSPAQIQISDFYRNDPPSRRAETQVVEVQVQVVLPTSDKTYELEWVETARSLSGQVQGEPVRWRGAFTLAINPPQDEKMARINPLGIYVMRANWSRIL
jgi:type IV secretion system protein VirB5